jgi:hypothetical protein
MRREAGKGEPPEVRGGARERAPESDGGAGRSGSEGPGGGSPEGEVPGREVPGSPGIWAVMREADRVEAERVGPFPSWAWLYWTVIGFGLLMIGILALLTRVLDPGSSQ